MTYTWCALAAVVVTLVIDLLVVRTRVVLTLQWWLSYVIVLIFQLLTNGWLTGRGIVRYLPESIIGGREVPFLGDGRIAYAPVEDLGFGFALVLFTVVVWVRLRPRPAAPQE